MDWERFLEPIPDLNTYIGRNLTVFQKLFFECRPFLQSKFDLQTKLDRTRFIVYGANYARYSDPEIAEFFPALTEDEWEQIIEDAALPLPLHNFKSFLIDPDASKRLQAAFDDYEDAAALIATRLEKGNREKCTLRPETVAKLKEAHPVSLPDLPICINILMYGIWKSQNELQQRYDLKSLHNQADFVIWCIATAPKWLDLDQLNLDCRNFELLNSVKHPKDSNSDLTIFMEIVACAIQHPAFHTEHANNGNGTDASDYNDEAKRSFRDWFFANAQTAFDAPPEISSPQNSVQATLSKKQQIKKLALNLLQRCIKPKPVISSKNKHPSAIVQTLKEKPSVSQTFETIYKNHYWKSAESVSGPGSDLAKTEVMRSVLAAVIQKHSIRSIFDGPCGDFNWMQHIDMRGVQYTGGDVVEPLIEKMNSQFANDKRKFKVFNLIEDTVPEVDLIVCRDGVAHLSNAQAAAVIENFKKSNSKFLIATTYPRTRHNFDIEAGAYHPLNLQLPPFNLPEPLALIPETPDGVATDDDYDKTIGLWDLQKVREHAQSPNVRQATETSSENPGVTVVAPVCGLYGNSQAARGLCLSLSDAGYPVSAYDFKPSFGGFIREDNASDHASISSLLTRYPQNSINLFAVPANYFLGVNREFAEILNLKNTRNILYGPWELSKYPKPWLEIASMFDEVWTQSHFVKNAIEADLGREVIYMPEPIAVQMNRQYSRQDFNLPPDKFLFLFSLDCYSSLSRKNPQAVLKAFAEAFPRENRTVGLVLKTINFKKPFSPVNTEIEAEIEKLMKDDDRVIFINEEFQGGDFFGLMSVCDCYVSLHRTEGFGRGMAEAMLLGIPVIATNYSGNIDFTTPETAFMVDYDLVPVKPGEFTFADGQVWAEVRVSHAAEQMREVMSNVALTLQRTSAAKNLIHNDFSYEACGKRYKARLEKFSKNN